MLKQGSTNRRVRFQRYGCQAFFFLGFQAALVAQDVRHVSLTPDGRFFIDGAATFPIGYTWVRSWVRSLQRETMLWQS